MSFVSSVGASTLECHPREAQRLARSRVGIQRAAERARRLNGFPRLFIRQRLAQLAEMRLERFAHLRAAPRSEARRRRAGASDAGAIGDEFGRAARLIAI
jgi:hypothetical protein